MTIYMLSPHLKTYIDEKENSGFFQHLPVCTQKSTFTGFSFFSFSPSLITPRLRLQKIDLKHLRKNGIWKNLPNLWNVLASSIGKSLTRTSKAPPTSAQNKCIFTAGENLFPLNFIKERVTGLGFLAAVAQNDNQ